MFRLDPETEKNFLEQFKKSVKSSGQFSVDNISSFNRKLSESLSNTVAPRPWFMNVKIFLYRIQLSVYQRLIFASPSTVTRDLSNQIEHVDSLHFAIRYGCRANAKQRAWCLQTIKYFGITPLDAPFLVWSRVINLQRQRIVFGHWDWVMGIIAMLLVLEFFWLTLNLAFNFNIPLILKIFLVTAVLGANLSLFDFFKKSTFGVFRVGTRYFRPNGWSYIPIQ